MANINSKPLPLSGITVIEFTHMVMGPTVGLVLADLGAEVIRIEPLGGDKTRELIGSGSGYFAMYNRNKKSLCVDLKSKEGKAIVKKLVLDADVLIENFRPGTLDRLGFDYESLSVENPGLIYCSQKGFLSGPYENRTALDEVTQMMGGLAYMTGPPGKPLRAGASVIDVMGGMFGAIAIFAAIVERHSTGKGQKVTSSLYESTVFLMGQHMAQFSVTGKAPDPMPNRVSAWAIYDVFDTGDNDQVFVGVVSDAQWDKFCRAFEITEWIDNADYSQNTDRVLKRDSIVPKIRSLFLTFTKAILMDKLEKIGLPFAPIVKPVDLFDDPHLEQSGGLLDLTLPNGTPTKLPAMPFEMAGERFGVRHDLTKPGENSDEILQGLNYAPEEIKQLINDGVIGVA